VLPAFVLMWGSSRIVVATHPLVLAIAIVVGLLWFVRRAPEPSWGLWAGLAIAVAGLLGARAWYLVLHGGPDTLGDAGLASMGGIGGAMIAAALAARVGGHPIALGLDVLVPPGLVGLGLGRLGCLLAGCCYGQPTHLPWGVVLPDVGSIPRHPLPLYDAAGDLLLARALARLPLKPAGRVARLGIGGYGALRAGLECLRDLGAAEPLFGGWCTVAQLAAILLLAGALVASGLTARWRLE
jgi:phosphatidylglycerol---prolipoprotein diacylglyceryl transferase